MNSKNPNSTIFNYSHQTGFFDATTIVAVRKNNQVAFCGDGQVSMGNTIMKGNAKKVRRIYQDKIIVGFAGSTADAFTLFEKFEGELNSYSGHLKKSAIELAKKWRGDKYLRQLQALMLVADNENTLLISGTGDVIEPEFDCIAIGSGGPFAFAAARALLENTKLDAKNIAEKAINIAADICVFTNHNIHTETL